MFAMYIDDFELLMILKLSSDLQICGIYTVTMHSYDEQ